MLTLLFPSYDSNVHLPEGMPIYFPFWKHNQFSFGRLLSFIEIIIFLTKFKRLDLCHTLIISFLGSLSSKWKRKCGLLWRNLKKKKKEKKRKNENLDENGDMNHAHKNLDERTVDGKRGKRA